MTKNVTEPKTNDKVSLKKKAEQKKCFGTYVTEKVRKTMFNILRETLHEYRHLIYSKYVVKDICNLIEHKNGKIAAADGEHDDMVMAYLHTLYILKYGYELGRYGINKNLCSYSQTREILDEYEKKISDDTIDNRPMMSDNSFETQLYNDLTRHITQEVSDYDNGRDDYGYTYNEYNQYGNLQKTPVKSNQNDISYFRELNDYGIYGAPVTSGNNRFSGFGLF